MSQFDIKWNEIDPGHRAYIYQAIEDFGPYLLPETNIGVFIRDVEDCQKEVEFVLETSGIRLRGQGQSQGIFKATQRARDHVLEQLTAAYEAMTLADGFRDGQVVKIH